MHRSLLNTSENTPLESTRITTEEALRESEERFRFLAEAMPQIVWTSPRGGGPNYYNAKWYEYTGTTFEDSRGVGWHSITHPEDLQQCMERWEHCHRTGEPFEAEVRLKRASDGAYRWHLARSLPRLNAAGEIVQWIGTSTDIDDVKRAQATLTQMNQMLEQEVATRTRELARSNEELKQFAYIASHDMQEPLRMIKSYTQLLARRYQGQIDGRADQYIAYVIEGVDRMHAQIQDLLTYSRMETEKKQFQQTNCTEIVATALKNLEIAATEAQAEITYGSLPDVMGDEVQLLSLFQNLIGNAIKYRSKEPPHIHISAQGRETEWLFAVQDNGIGIAPQFAERIFVVFQRLHTREEYPGTGIGLALCKKIVAHHGGRIWLESKPGQGSTFFFVLPMTRNQSETDE